MTVDNNHYIHSQWGSRFVFIMAVTGSAVGLGNVWRFPYITGEHGGGAFVLLYLFFVVALGLPVIMSEIMLGRLGKHNTIDSFNKFRTQYRTSSAWKIIGLMGIITGILILSFYSVIAGWLVFYMSTSVTDTFNHLSASGSSNIFDELIADPKRMILWHSIFMVITALVFTQNINAGIGRVVAVSMPLLLLLIISIIVYNFYNTDIKPALFFLFEFKWDDLHIDMVMVAMAQAFFSLSIGMGAIMIYGSYLPDKIPLLSTTATIVVADTVVAILSCLMIFPILFSVGLDMAEGPGLIFKTLPIAFAQMPGGNFISFAFFALLFLAAWTSALSLLEPGVAWLVERTGWTRGKAAAIIATVTWFLGLATIFSFNIWQEVKLWGKTPFALIDGLTSYITMPLGGLLIILFAGWVLPRMVSKQQFALKSDVYYLMWYWSVRYFCPLLLLAIMIASWMH